MSKLRYFTVDTAAGGQIARFTEEKLLGNSLAEWLKLELREIIRSSNDVLVLDFTNVTMLSSSVIQALLDARKQSGARGVRLKLSSMSDTVREVFKISHLDATVFEIFETVDEALKADTTFFEKHGRHFPSSEE